MHRPGFVGTRRFQIFAFGLAVALAVSCKPGPAPAQDSPLWMRDTFSGDWDGARERLSKKGIDLGLTYRGEVFGNLAGGVERGATYEDLIHFRADANLEKILGWRGAIAHVSADQIDDGGRNIEDLVEALSDPSNIDALPTTRLYTLWVQQRLGGAGSVRVGQIAADDEFLISTTASGLINNTFAWANFVDINLRSGGPAYPLPTPGARLKLEPTDKLTALAAVFSGNPAGSCGEDQDPQVCNRYGTTFSFTGGALFMGEVQYRPHPDEGNGTVQSAYKLGGFYHTGDFTDQARGNGNDGQIVSLAVDPSDPLELQGNWGVYAVVDQAVWRSGRSAAAIFWRGGVVPADRNLVSWYVDGGFALAGPFRARPNDRLSFGVAYSNISNEAVTVDQIRRRIDDPTYPIRDGETAFELSYIAELAPWWTLQPDLQYIVHPGGDVPDPDDPERTVGNSVLIGLRTTVTF